ncbi:hypothetical protein J7T55_013206 [Diaporthe amygdali]|uniref:uncharacterized protein n=1 Tax=Phomopsis amygdali TaxID=1214568 RepID=UPI0022FEDB7E|nr:uncharacterized protein J7T55_013206 [Diaporthe amygdali]KAJ0118950.1 hypothetical protein J7T55_013206 [Diaporthe amygdali]
MLTVSKAQPEDASHDVDAVSRDARPAPEPELNGESPANVVVDKLVNDIVDEVVNSAEVSVSGGSDTEASKSRSDDKGHVRSSSVKKPTSFKSVPINKSFQAKLASSSAAAKVPEKTASTASSTAGPPSTSSTPKPRLVAKTTGTLRDASKSSLAQNGRPAPDGNAVWNKNRPPPTPDLKKMTDEELLKLGIHVANRLQPDVAKGQAAWADIDESDDEWDAPETITWTDGTKTTIPHADEPVNVPEPPPPAPAIAPVPVLAPAAKESKPLDKPRSPAPPAGSPSVKPSLPSGKGLILKGAPEKPTLVAKPPAPPTPVKSPWAALPPVQKASPMEVAGEQPQRGFPPPGPAYGVKGVTPPAAREIAADDFSRSPRRDHRELYNSHSGRYEPVADRRGMPVRPEYQPRQPALLQRPSHGETQGPAEPSAAFQTSHTSGGYGRRRGSSNVSGGSGSFQRLGRPYEQGLPPSEMLDPRRGSFTGASDHPTSPRNFSPSDHHGGPRQPSASPWQHRASPAISHAAPSVPGSSEMQTVPPANPVVDDVEFQKKLMKERREEAIRRRQEEEAREEAAKQERLRKKLEALGPAPERKSEKKEVHKETAGADQLSETPQQAPASQEAKETKPTATPPNPLAESSQDTLPNGVGPDAQSHAKAPATAEQPPAPENKHAHPWNPRVQTQNPTDRLTWNAGSQAPKNVWGPPTNDRSLGNGTFNSVPTQPSQLAPVRSGRPGPGPIAPPSATSKPPGPHSQPAPIGPPQRSGSRAQPQDDNAQRRNKWTSAVLASDEDTRLQRQKQQRDLEQDMKARGLDYSDLAAPINEAWTSTKEDEQGQRVRDSMQWVLRGNNAQNSASRTAGAGDLGQQDAAARFVPPPVSQNGSTTSGSQRSRFFPPTREVDQTAPIAPETGRSQSPSPPPPDMAGHPAFDGDMAHPHVSLPPTKPIVKLPPAAPSSFPASQRSGQPSSARSASSPQSLSSRPFSSSGPGSNHTAPNFWQDRIKNLLADNSSNPPSVDSSSRTSLLQPTHRAAATVSLPTIFAPSSTVDDGSFATKTMAEDCFEEQEMGSLPPVHLPTQIPEAAWEPAKAPPRQDRRLKEAITTSAEALMFHPEGRNYVIFLPSMSGRRTVAMAASSVSSPQGRRPQRASRYSSSYRGGNRNRDSSEQGGPSGSNFSRGGRGSYRGRSEWNRAAATPIQTQ